MSPDKAVDNIQDPALRYWAMAVAASIEQLRKEVEKLDDQNREQLQDLANIKARLESTREVSAAEKGTNKAWIMVVWGLVATVLGGTITALIVKSMIGAAK